MAALWTVEPQLGMPCRRLVSAPNTSAPLTPPCPRPAGVVTLWDVESRSMVREYEAHSRRIWSIDSCGADPTLLASGSDDCRVKLWSTQVRGGCMRGLLRLVGMLAVQQAVPPTSGNVDCRVKLRSTQVAVSLWCLARQE